MARLKGITWGHSRGYTSVVATAQRFGELHPGVDIQWEKRSLQAFADGDLNALARVKRLIARADVLIENFRPGGDG